MKMAKPSMSKQQHIVSEASEEAVDAAITEALGDAYDCIRAWSAWSCGTMGPDDFHCVADDSERVAEIRSAAIAALQPEFETLKRQRDQLLAAIRGVLDDAEECKDADDWTAMLLSLEVFHNLDTAYNEVIASAKGGAA